MVQIPCRVVGLFLAVMVVDTLALEVWSVREGWSIPAFGRKYQFACQDCHVDGSRKLNEFGQRFQEQGYQLPADHGQSAEAYREEPQSPAAIFARHCAACHGVKGKGDGPMGEVLNPPASDLTSPSIQSKSDDELLRIMQEGTPRTTMPAFKRRLTMQELRGVLAYVRRFNE